MKFQNPDLLDRNEIHQQALRSGMCVGEKAVAAELYCNNNRYTHYVVNTESPICSQVGAHIIESGGNAMDAAVASAICVGVVNSFSSGIGGGGFLLLRKKVDGRDVFDMFDFRETAPEGLSIEDLQKSQNTSKVGGMAVCTPGEVMGLYEAHREYGKLPWARLFEENIVIARGFKASRLLVEKLNNNKETILGDDGFRAVFVRDGELIKEGDVVVRENYAQTLEKIAQDPMAFYKGELADKIVASIQRNGGVLTRKDMEGYRAKKRDVLEGKYLDFKVYTTSLPTSGVLVLEALKILEHVDFNKLRTVDQEDGMYIFYHMLIETFKFISAKRGELGDPDFLESYKLIVSNLMSNKHADNIFQKIKTTNTLEHNDYEQAVPFVEDHGTTHLNVVDQDGMIVQITSTINLEFGAKFMDPETGIIFNNQIDDFFIPQIENSYSLSPMIGNLVQRKKRPFSSISPIFLIKDEEVLALGGTGGTRIPTAILGTLAYLFLGHTLEQAVSNTRMHHQLLPNVTYVEQNFPLAVWSQLEKAGHKLEVSRANSIFTSVQAIHVTEDATGGRVIHAVSDMRKHGQPMGK